MENASNSVLETGKKQDHVPVWKCQESLQGWGGIDLVESTYNQENINNSDSADNF